MVLPAAILALALQHRDPPWLTYGSFLHARLFFRLRPLATAWSSVAAFAVFVLTLLVLPLLLPSIHAAYFQ